MKLTLILSSLFFSLHIFAALPKDAQQVVDALPDKALTMELILTRGAASSESFKQVKAEAVLIPGAKLRAEGPYVTKFKASAGYQDDRSEQTVPFNPDSTQGTSYSVGASKYFQTGTALDINLEHNDVDLTYPSPSTITIPDYYQTELSLGFSQNLLKDSFGYSSRRLLKAGHKLSESQEHRAEVALEEWTLSIANLFYAAWLSKQALIVADDAVKRRQQLLKTTRLKTKRGTSETPDLLQVESIHLMALNRQDESSQDLNNHWRNLILSLKLPAEWINVDPRFVPIILDDPISEAEKVCQSFRQTGVPKEESATVRMNQALLESAKLRAQAMKNQVLPELNLVGELAFNGVDFNKASESLNEGTGTDNPAWQVGLNLTIPLSRDAEKADYIQAYAEEIQLESSFNSAKDDLRVAWMNECSNLDRLQKNAKQAESAYEKQRQRERLEERRFRLGRVPLFNFIQAGDDAADAELYHKQQEVRLRQSAWQVLKNASKIQSVFEKMKLKFEKDIDS